jgi:hypothetical protein
VAPQRGGGTAAVIQRGSGALCALRRDAAALERAQRLHLPLVASQDERAVHRVCGVDLLVHLVVGQAVGAVEAALCHLRWDGLLEAARREAQNWRSSSADRAVMVE